MILNETELIIILTYSYYSLCLLSDSLVNIILNLFNIICLMPFSLRFV